MTALNIDVDNAVWKMAGALTFGTLSNTAKTWCAQFPKAVSPLWHIECQQVTKIDSCGLAFLLACRRHAKARNITLNLVGIPQDATALMHAQGVASLLIQK